MSTRPHRRDRRKTAVATRGGAINELNFLQGFFWPSVRRYQIKVVRITNDPLSNGSENIPIVGAPGKPIIQVQIPTQGIKAMVAGSEVPISRVYLTDENTINIEFTQDQSSAVTIVIMPFNNFFRGIRGSVNAGGFVETTPPSR